ncbi:MAG TPA: hypothetical protein VGB24_24315 [Longimicrobium sp.]|jgi:hypothetical protein|uniref:hypothetical protein n=1 Tax=Longimicrobium sp. TaxID=2029185 RepID=UPI002ED916C4
MINPQRAGIAARVPATAAAAGPTEAQAPVRVPRSVLERYVGEYDQNGNTIKVFLEGDTLLREVPGQRAAFVPISETLFRIGAVFTAEFVIDEAGGVTQVLSDGVDLEFRLPRKGSPAAPPPAADAGVRVPRSVLERYVGTYEYIPGQMSRTDLKVVVRLEGDTLIRSLGQEAVLTPISETRFRVGNTSLVTEFVVDEAGVTQVMGSGFQQMLARLEPQR